MKTIHGMKCVTVQEAAEIIGIEPGTVRTLVRMGTLGDVIPPQPMLIPIVSVNRYQDRITRGVKGRPRKKKEEAADV